MEKERNNDFFIGEENDDEFFEDNSIMNRMIQMSHIELRASDLSDQNKIVQDISNEESLIKEALKDGSLDASVSVEEDQS